MLGYWERPDATAEALAGGELHTGDVGFLDDDGYLHLRDRKSLVIIRGGANVYPAEVERVLLEAPGWRPAPCSACPTSGSASGWPRWSRRPPAPRSTWTPSRDHCWPTWPGTRSPSGSSVVDPLPRNAMGKIVRTELPALLTSAATP